MVLRDACVLGGLAIAVLGLASSVESAKAATVAEFDQQLAGRVNDSETPRVLEFSERPPVSPAAAPAG